MDCDLGFSLTKSQETRLKNMFKLYLAAGSGTIEKVENMDWTVNSVFCQSLLVNIGLTEDYALQKLGRLMTIMAMIAADR